MHQRPGQHPGEDLGVDVRMVRVARSGPDPVVVVHQQRPEADVARVVVGAEGEAVPGVGAARSGCGTGSPPGAPRSPRPPPAQYGERPGRPPTLGACCRGPSPSPSRRGRSRSGTTRGPRRSGPATSRSWSCWAAWRSARRPPAGGCWRPRTRRPTTCPASAFSRRRAGPAPRALVLRVEGPGVLPGRGRRGQGRAAGGLVLPRPVPGVRGPARARRRVRGGDGPLPGRRRAGGAAAGRVLRRLDHLSRERAVQGGSRAARVGDGPLLRGGGERGDAAAADHHHHPGQQPGPGGTSASGASRPKISASST